LPRETEELFVPGRVTFSDGGEVLVFMAEKQDLAKVPVFFRLNLRDAIQYRSFEIQFHHDADSLGQSGVHAYGEIQRANGRGKAPVRPRCQGRGVGVHRSEAKSFDRRSGRIRRRV